MNIDTARCRDEEGRLACCSALCAHMQECSLEPTRLQSFPDWFEFKGKYTTGGQLRRREVPRFTQVANAVPPLVARAIGLLLKEILEGKLTASTTAVRSSSQTGMKRSEIQPQVQQ